SSLWGNCADNGGGIFNDGNMTVTNSTLSANSAVGDGGGIYTGDVGRTATLNNTIVANSASGGDIFFDGSHGSTLVGSNNLIEDGSYLSNFTNSLQGDPKLLPLAWWGGATQTARLQPGSPAIDAGSNSLAVDPSGRPLSVDQRGLPRFSQGRSVDVGAVEEQRATLVVNTVRDDTIPDNALSLREAIDLVNARGNADFAFHRGL